MGQELDISPGKPLRDVRSNVFGEIALFFERVISSSAPAAERSEGVAFLRAAKELYGVADLMYVCINIPVYNGTMFAHCLYSDRTVRHVLGPRCSEAEALARLGTIQEEDCTETATEVVLPLQQQQDEVAVLAVGLHSPLQAPPVHRPRLMRELRVLGNYFHGHNLRINGHDGANEIIMSARELDCLRWAAVGKTAWEASVILGISERTVRFHLNAAREKLGCATTTQAVAKAVASHIIEI